MVLTWISFLWFGRLWQFIGYDYDFITMWTQKCSQIKYVKWIQTLCPSNQICLYQSFSIWCSSEMLPARIFNPLWPTIHADWKFWLLDLRAAKLRNQLMLIYAILGKFVHFQKLRWALQMQCTLWNQKHPFVFFECEPLHILKYIFHVVIF